MTLTKKEKDRIFKLAGEGLGVTEIAGLADRNRKTVAKYLAGRQKPQEENRFARGVISAKDVVLEVDGVDSPLNVDEAVNVSMAYIRQLQNQVARLSEQSEAMDKNWEELQCPFFESNCDVCGGMLALVVQCAQCGRRLLMFDVPEPELKKHIMSILREGLMKK